jgi:hypothetical protein
VAGSLRQCRGGWAGVLERGTVAEGLRRYFTAITPLQSLECCRRVFGTAIGVEILMICGRV